MRTVLSQLPDAGSVPVHAIERCPDRMELLTLFGEIRDTRAEIHEMSETLYEMGVDLKERGPGGPRPDSHGAR